MRRFKNMTEVRQCNDLYGYHWFERDTMRFFKSRVGNTVYGGKYFISSEQREWNTPRRYTVREALETGNIETVSEFMQYATWQGAYDRIQTILRGA
jgi:hypothetical protein